jgi:hypothetical protein
VGASIEQTGPDTYRVRWSQVEDGRRRPRQTTVRGTRTEAEAYRAVVVHDLRTKGFHDPSEHRPGYHDPANLADGLLAWLKAAEQDGTALPGEDPEKGGLAPSTVRGYRGQLLLLLAAIHQAEGIPTSEPLLNKLKPILARRGATVPNQSLALLWEAWTWLADDPKSWSQVPVQPRVKRGFVPPGRTYGVTVAPTLAHADAALRHLAVRRVRRDSVAVAVVMRYTGLRISQVVAIHREDLDLASGSLLVRKGKTRAENADRRIVPLSRHLLAEPLFRAAVERAKPGGPVFRTQGSQVIDEAWEAATAAGEVPLYTWAPPNRTNRRVNHAFRAVLIAYLRDRHVASDVIGLLVGHVRGNRDRQDPGEKVEATHYGRTLDDEAREVVDTLDPVDWIGPQPLPGVVPFKAREGTG